MPLRLNQDGSLPLLRDESNRTYINPTALIELAAALNTGPAAGFQFPVGALYLSVDPANPADLFGYGTWGQVAQGLLLIGQSGVQTGGQSVGSATHGHTFSQPSDHAAVSHSGATVGNHSFTQPSAHSFTQPAGHAAHSFTQPTGHSNHVVTQPAAHSNHAVTQPADHAAIIAHTHGLNAQGGTTAATTGTHLMTSTATGGSARAITAGDAGLSSGTGAAMAHSATAVDAHSAHSATAVDAHSTHSGGAVDAHSAHSGGAVDAHAGGAVDAHGVTQASQHAAQAHSGGAVAVGTTDPPSFVAYVWQRTA